MSDRTNMIETETFNDGLELCGVLAMLLNRVSQLGGDQGAVPIESTGRIEIGARTIIRLFETKGEGKTSYHIAIEGSR